MIPARQQNFNPKDPMLDRSGMLTNEGRYLLLKLWERTGLGSGVDMEVAQIVAAGADQASATLLGKDVCEVTGSPGGVILFTLQPGQSQWVYNVDGGGIQVYPPVGSQIDALALNAAYALAAARAQIFTCFSQTQYRTLQLG